MADQSDLTKALFEALLTGDEPEGWRTARILDCWRLVASPDEKELAVSGLLPRNDLRFRSAPLRAVDVARRFVMTEDKIYRLGWPERASLEPDAAFVWPPALCVAACTCWLVAIVDAVSFAGEDNLPPELLSKLEGASRIGDWTARWAICRMIADHLHAAGRKPLAEAWSLLGADLRSTTDRMAGAMFVTAARERAAGMYERDLTVDETLADDGWRRLGGMDDAQVENMSMEGVPIMDPIAAPRHAALIARRAAGIPQQIDLGQEQVDTGPASGVVVLKALGGIDSSWSGREAAKAFAPIVRKRLPVTPPPDIAAARRALAAEFPYALAAIDVMLGDLVGAASCRFRPTLLASQQVGTGKSRLARRIGEISGLYVARFDGTGASDSAFGGTPRRWSTGEPSVPLAALLAARKADALVILDEVEKSGTSRHNGRLSDSLLPFLENETAARFPDPYAGEVDLSRVSYIATCNNELDLPAPLRDRFRLLRIPVPTIDDLPAICRCVVADLIRESGVDAAWTPDLQDDELSVAQHLWLHHGRGSIRRLREIVARIVAHRANLPRH